MIRPAVSVIWLNYNSMNFINVAKKSLMSIAQEEIPLELILVDNNSTDGSFEVLSEFVGKLDLKVKVIRLKKNYGFTGGNNIGYLYSDRASRYIALINNDLIIEEGSIAKLVNFLDDNKGVGAVQGIIYDITGKDVSNAGFICSELLTCYSIREPLEKPCAVTFASGAYLVARREAVERIGKLFDWEGFLYFDDWPLGYRLWMHGYKVKALPYPAGRHLESASTITSTAKKVFYGARGHSMLVEISNSRFRRILKLLMLKNTPVRLGLLNPSLIKAFHKGLIEGFKLGSIKRKNSEIIDIYAAPMIKSPTYNVLDALTPRPLLEALVVGIIQRYIENLTLKQ